VERLQASLHYIEGGTGSETALDKNDSNGRKRKHTIYVETAQDAQNFSVAEHFDTLEALADRAFNRPRVATLKAAALATDATPTTASTRQLLVAAKQAKLASKKAAKARAAAYAEVQARVQRAAAMERAEAHLMTEKLVASKGRKRKIRPAENGRPAVYQWRHKRQG
jgi:U3 small nucleolar RNA-associated protein 11